MWCARGKCAQHAKDEILTGRDVLLELQQFITDSNADAPDGVDDAKLGNGLALA